MNIGLAAQKSGLSAKTIRYYEDIGLIIPARKSNGYRDYSDNDSEKLRFLQRSRSLGFSIEDCRKLLSLYEDKSRASLEVKNVAKSHLQTVERKIAELKTMQITLTELVANCHGDNMPECPILNDLSGMFKEK